MNQAVTLDSMLTARQVADFLQVSICSVRRWSDSGALKFYRVGSRGDRRYQRDDVLQFLEDSSRCFGPARHHHQQPASAGTPIWEMAPLHES